MFDTLTLDLDDPASVASAADLLVERRDQIDVLLLNAGVAATSDVRRTLDGVEATVAATLTGHHLLTMRLLNAGSASGRKNRGVNVTSVPNVAVGAVHPLRCEFMGGRVGGWVPDKPSAPH